MIQVDNIQAGYQGSPVLHGISFELESGKNLSIIGPNGCGKTTLLRVLAGVLPFSGQVQLDGVNLRDFKRKALAKKVAMLSQATQLYFNYTVFDTVMMGRYVHESDNWFGIGNSTSTADQEAVISALETVDMLQFKDREVDTLSGGQLQRVFLAKIIAQNPDIVLLDEPTNHLDLSYQIELIDFFQKWSKETGKTIIGVLHDLNLAMRLSDHVLLMENGNMKAFGTNQDVYASDALLSAYRMDVTGYMLDTLEKWKVMAKE